MRLCRDLNSPSTRPSVVALGNFDGVHLGHAAVLQQLSSIGAARGLQTTVISFAPHPRDYFANLGRGIAAAHIASVRDRLALLAASSVARILLLRFNTALAQMPAREFVEKVLVSNCAARCVVVGRDVRFGHARAGDLALLQTLGAEFGFEVVVLDDVALGLAARVSSSAVRAALAAGDVLAANGLLGRPYALSGRVVHGRKIGRTLGCPTLNVAIRLPLPAVQGIWVVHISGLGGRVLQGVASLGLRPTVEQTTRYSLEVHIFDWSGNAYGRRVEIAFLHKLRDEAAYVDLPTLQVAIEGDMRDARAWLAGI